MAQGNELFESLDDDSTEQQDEHESDSDLDGVADTRMVIETHQDNSTVLDILDELTRFGITPKFATRGLWDNGQVPYLLQRLLTTRYPSLVKVIYEAIDLFHRQINCVRWELRSTDQPESTYVTFKYSKEKRCHTNVGKSPKHGEHALYLAQLLIGQTWEIYFMKWVMLLAYIMNTLE